MSCSKTGFWEEMLSLMKNKRPAVAAGSTQAPFNTSAANWGKVLQDFPATVPLHISFPWPTNHTAARSA
jgi:hypothetical protein